jgi:hypothetical protein
MHVEAGLLGGEHRRLEFVDPQCRPCRAILPPQARDCASQVLEGRGRRARDRRQRVAGHRSVGFGDGLGIERFLGDLRVEGHHRECVPGGVMEFARDR